MHVHVWQPAKLRRRRETSERPGLRRRRGHRGEDGGRRRDRNGDEQQGRILDEGPQDGFLDPGEPVPGGGRRRAPQPTAPPQVATEQSTVLMSNDSDQLAYRTYCQINHRPYMLHNFEAHMTTEIEIVVVWRI